MASSWVRKPPSYPTTQDARAPYAYDASAKAKLEANFIVSFHYELKTAVVDAYGAGTQFCKWFMHEGKNLRNDVLFYPIIRTPKAVTGFECEFEAAFQIGHPAWTRAEFFNVDPQKIAVSV
jgi:hypothetical protein